jgi:hypothetical protein
VFGSLRMRRLERAAEFRRRYTSWSDAMPDACAALFSLNRFAKHGACSMRQREIIYQLKNEMVELLYSFAVYRKACWLHLVKCECWGCGGNGCGRCDGTGVHHTLEFVAFRFEVGGKAYCWHQPRYLVDTVRMKVAYTEEPKYWDGVVGEKPVGLRRGRFAAAKELVAWVLREARR